MPIVLGLCCQLCLDFLANSCLDFHANSCLDFLANLCLDLGYFSSLFIFSVPIVRIFVPSLAWLCWLLDRFAARLLGPLALFGTVSGSNFVTALARLLAQLEEGAVHGGPVDAGVLMPAAAVTAGLVYIAARADLLLHLCEEETLQSLTTVVYRHFEFPEPVSKQCTWLASNWRWTKLLTC